MTDWQNVKWVRSQRPKAGKGTFVLTMIFMGVIGGALGLFLFVARTGDFAMNNPLAGFSSRLSMETLTAEVMAFVAGGALVGMSLTFKFWPRAREAQRDLDDEEPTPDERLSDAVRELATVLEDGGEKDWGFRLEEALAARTRLDMRAQIDELLRELRESEIAGRLPIEAELREALMCLSVARSAM